ncbi:glycosyl hydrolase family 32 [Actinoplanes sp. ATCC 53533]|uniref:GH32 C-terminal domain-containing protein n=1 Tax=Actinoplanes sp. ATCC 53533 TaxID=1288362 RepID=UPI000F79CC14|nr:GH32 C-terminal domain-containing protein [Actinoplanes sp. ATCC 53533]RSM74094.1 glycosyl hydrolase family 32 [Actinoplanes sp. ATCC 53533]
MRRRLATPYAAAALTAAIMVGVSSASSRTAPEQGPSAAPAFAEPHRPQFHFTPERNWMNDPNGLVYHEGEYHLFFQYNPDSDQWGNMSWGHAVSTDLVHWQELPLAISHDDAEMVFSGSAVVDHGNTTGFGTADEPAMVAVYTRAPKAGGSQAQSLAYSTDRGRTWTKYAGNPVLDIGSGEFRDPKVQWHAPTKRWLMAVVLSTEHKVRFYSSKDLKSWTHLSDFGPAGAVGGVWECPDLFELPVDGETGERKWVLVVSLNPGGIQGGSATQYFVGDFDGTTFTPDDDGSYSPPAGSVVQDFEAADFADWTATGTAFGPGPSAGGVAGQHGVTGFVGERLANSYHGGDAPTGTLTSPEFTASEPYLNFLVGGGKHPHDPDAVPRPAPAPAGTVLADFEGGSYGQWTPTGRAFGAAPATGALPGQQPVSGWLGDGLVNTFVEGDSTVGTLTSPTFTIDKAYLNFLIGGGYHPTSVGDPTAVNLLVDGEIVRTATAADSEALNWAGWDVSDLVGNTARIQVVDANTGGWGHLNLDHVVLSDTRARPASTETSVNLLVGGKVVQSVTGPDSGVLDWAHFDLRAYQGGKVQVQVVDNNTGGWGHIMADRFVAAGAPARSAAERVSWVDYGKDYYAAISFDNAPGGRRYMIGWTNNWQYAGDVPTVGWRGAMSVPREMGLRRIDGKLRLIQRPVSNLAELRQGPAVTAQSMTITADSPPQIPGARGRAVEIEATFSLRDAERFGIKVHTGAGQETVIGYDVPARQVYVDRSRSGAVDFSRDFAGVHRAPLEPRNGTVTLRILVDWSSVEVFGGQGQVVLTDQVFPGPGGDGVRVFAERGSVRLDDFQLWQLGSYRS